MRKREVEEGKREGEGDCERLRDRYLLDRNIER